MKGWVSLLEGLAARVPGAFFLAMLGLGTGDVLRVGGACSSLLAAVEGGHATEVCERGGGESSRSSWATGTNCPRVVHHGDCPSHLRWLLSSLVLKLSTPLVVVLALKIAENQWKLFVVPYHSAQRSNLRGSEAVP